MKPKRPSKPIPIKAQYQLAHYPSSLANKVLSSIIACTTDTTLIPYGLALTMTYIRTEGSDAVRVFLVALPSCTLPPFVEVAESCNLMEQWLEGYISGATE